MTTTNLPNWRQLGDKTWHVEIAPSAALTACKRKIRASAPSSTRPQPTICDECRLHYRQAKRSGGQPRPGARRQQTITTTRYGADPAGDIPPPQRRPPRPAEAPPATPPAEAAPATGDPVQIPPGYGWLRVGDLAACLPLDEIRAMLSGQAAEATPPADEGVAQLGRQRRPDDEAWLRWYGQQPLHRRLELLQRAARQQQRDAPLDECVVAVQDGALLVIPSGTSVIGKSWDRVLWAGPGCDDGWLDGLATRFNSAELGLRWRAERRGNDQAWRDWYGSLDGDSQLYLLEITDDDPTRALLWRPLPLPQAWLDDSDRLDGLALALLIVDDDGTVTLDTATSELREGDMALQWYAREHNARADSVATAWCWLQRSPGGAA